MTLVAGGGLTGGISAPPGSFTVLGQRPDILVQSPTSVVDAVTITVQENIYGVVFQFTIPKSQWVGMGTQGEANLYASYVQHLGGMTEVVGMAYSQDVNAAGLLVDEMIVTVGTPDLVHTADVAIPFSWLGTGNDTQAVTSTYQTVIATSQLT